MMLEIIAWFVALPVMWMFAVLLAETCAGQFASVPEPVEIFDRTIAVLIPAHNEERGIGKCVASVLNAAPPGLRVVVVADNCSDATAQVARDAGAQVIERTDPDHRGKGFALACGRDGLRASPPSAVVVLDADCPSDPLTLADLAAVAFRRRVPVQACYALTADTSASPVVQISNFAFLLKNHVRQRGLARIGGVAVLTGTGMAFPWHIFEAADLASGNIVEDLAIGIDQMRAGNRSFYLERARVESAAAGHEETLSQRRRWEHGFLAMARAYALPLMAQGLVRRDVASVALGAHLSVPPLALLLLLGSLVLAMLAIATLFGGGSTAFWVLAALMIATIAMIAVSWYRYGRATLTVAAIAQIPLYVLWKIPNYIRLVTAPEKSWTRTRREGE